MATTTSPATAVTEPLRAVAREYKAEPDRLAGYGALLATYAAGIAAFASFLRMSGRRLPRKVDPADVALLGVATFKLSRLISRDAVTGVVRAPFTTRAGQGKGSEIQDKPRGRGLRRAVGELITCPFCISQWLATILGGAYVVAPDATRMAAATLTAVTVADALQYAHTALQDTVD
ncbi:MAG: hypothetical protein QOE35_2496 [Actinomycetota bacterium]|jgi:hypothetical protein